jgi:hypothetical protein
MARGDLRPRAGHMPQPLVAATDPTTDDIAPAALGVSIDAAVGPALALPEDVGAVELAVFVGIGGLLQLIGGQTTSA